MITEYNRYIEVHPQKIVTATVSCGGNHKVGPQKKKSEQYVIEKK